MFSNDLKQAHLCEKNECFNLLITDGQKSFGMRLHVIAMVGHFTTVLVLTLMLSEQKSDCIRSSKFFQWR